MKVGAVAQLSQVGWCYWLALFRSIGRRPCANKNLEAGQIELISLVATNDRRHRDDTLLTLPRLD